MKESFTSTVCCSALVVVGALVHACSSSDGESDNESSGGTPGLDGGSGTGGASSGGAGGGDNTGGQGASTSGGAGPNGSGGAGGSAELEYAPCSADTKVGDFKIELAPDHPDAPQFTSILGKVVDGVVPIQVPEVETEDGDCRLLTNPNLTCDPPCGVNETCAETGCIAYPVARDIGAVSITGLKVPVEMMPSASSKSYSNPAQPMLPHPGFDPGANIVLDAEGGEYDAFELLGWGIEPLQVAETELVVREEQPLTVEWTAPTQMGPARMSLNLNIDNHGVTSARIECDTADDGSFDISASLIDELIGQGFSGFPTLTLSRRTVDSTSIAPGCVEFIVSSELTLGVDLEGLTSCNDNTDCPTGEVCQPDLSCGAP